MARKRGNAPSGSNKAAAAERIDEIFELYATGMSMRRVAEVLGIKVSKPELLLYTIRQDDEWREWLRKANEDRADAHADTAMYRAEEAAETGDVAGLKVAIDQLNKAAARAAPAEHADVTRTEVVLKADPNLKPADAYDRMVNGK